MVGMEKEIRLRMVLTEEKMPREITIEQFAKGMTQGNLACLRLAPTTNSFELQLSFDAKCMIKHVEVSIIACYQFQTVHSKILGDLGFSN